MIDVIKGSLAFMTPSERFRYVNLSIFRSLMALLDLAAILAIGFLATSIAWFLTSGSNPNRTISFGLVELQTVNSINLPLYLGGITALFLLKALVSLWLTSKIFRLLANVEARAAVTIARRAFGTSLKELRKRSIDDIIFAIQVGSPQAFNVLLASFSTLLAETTLFLTVLSMFLIVDAPLAILSLAYFLGVSLLIQKVVGRKVVHESITLNAGIVEANGALGDLSAVYREASLAGIKEHFFGRVFSAREKTASSVARQEVLSSTPRYIIETAALAGAGVLFFTVFSTLDLISAAGVLSVFLVGALRLIASIMPLQGAVIAMQRATPGATKALSFLFQSSFFQPVEIRSSSIKSGPIGVNLRGVSFFHSGESSPTLENITFSIAPGSQIALIGPSGSGKSTISDLILGLQAPTSGEVSLNGIKASDFIDMNPGSVSFVPQNPGMVQGSIRENVTLLPPNPELEDTKLSEVLSRSHLDEVLEGLNKGADSDLGKRKDSLSGGQLQRIGIARALYTNPGLLVFDEATSSLDSASEAEIGKTLKELKGSVTVVLIAHRLNTLKNCDRVFLIEGGKLITSGKLDDLVKSNETVRKLVEHLKVSVN